ncbi:hypothetical protein LSAT2_010422 [Lamellibrachia satsuma]|nr:hypothetical protein LSAT2_010422 [Lamellibrachia satsuma]
MKSKNPKDYWKIINEPKGDKGLTVFVEGNDITRWFNSSNVDDDADYTGLSITKKNTTQLIVAFKSGFSLTIGVSAEQLDITVGAPDTFINKTKGLMGVFNGDATDDLLPPGDNALPLSNSSTEKTIFVDFGERWRIDSLDSLFYYAPGESYSTYARTDFKPLFIEDVLRNMTTERRTKATETCGDNKECIFDYAVTDKAEAAAATLETNSKNVKVAETLSNASPNITVEAVFNAMVGMENILAVSAFDPDGDDVTITPESSLDGATFDGGVFKWTPVNMEPVNISFSASDGKGGVASADVTVNLCNCTGHGECQFDQLADGYELKQSFRVVQCSCSKGWGGDYCEEDFDGCQDNPCTEGTNCTDMTADEEVLTGQLYNCSECPAGTMEDGGICFPINECDPENPLHDCEQICVKQKTGFTCACEDGYRLKENQKNCSEIDECAEGTSQCEHQCKNTNGSFQCSCFDGYSLNTDNLKCSIDVDECSNNTAGCDHNCTNFDGGFNCSCNDGFQLMSDKISCTPCLSGTWGEDCKRLCNCRESDTVCNVTAGCEECAAGFTGGDCHEDIDECAGDEHRCDEHANCTNTVGTFKCTCHVGFTQFNATVCQDFDECNSDPCDNGGECINGNNNYTCDCLAGYTGVNCETEINECESSPCSSDGTCQDLVNRYRCACIHGYTGERCETDLDNECASSPCVNGATCEDKVGGFLCHCIHGYSGDTCNTDINECSSSPCENGGTCSTQQLNMFSCKCAAGYTGTNCESDVDECGSNPCQNGGKCQDGLNTYQCSCASGYTGIHCDRGFPATLPASMKTRLTVSVKLLDKTFSRELSDKFSSKYKALKSIVVEAPESDTGHLAHVAVPNTSRAPKTPYAPTSLFVPHLSQLKFVLDVKLGPGKYEIDGVTFKSGSIVVTYEVVVPKKESTVMQSNITTAIKKHSGSFAGSAIDGNHVSIAETTIIRYYGQFRVPELEYVDNYGVDTSDEYMKLAEEVRFTLSEIYQADIRVGSRLVNVTDITFTKGSVVVDFFLWVDSTLSNWDVLQDILGKVPFSVGGRAVDLKSVKLSDKELEDADFPWLPVILGSVLAVILLICVILLVVHNCNISRNTASSSSIDNHLYSPNRLRRDRLWRQTSPRNPIDPSIDPQYQVH